MGTRKMAAEYFVDPDELKRSQMSALADVGSRELPIEREVPPQPTNAEQPYEQTVIPPQPGDVPRAPLRQPDDQPMNRLRRDVVGLREPSAVMSQSPGTTLRSDSGIGGGLLSAFARGLTAFGGGDVGALDKMRADRESAPFRKKMESAQLAQMEEGVSGRRVANQRALEMIDPNSAYSKQRQTEHAETMKATADVLRNVPQFKSLASLYESEAANAAGKTAAHLDASAERLGKALGASRQVVDAMAQQELAKQGQGMRERGVVAQEQLAKNTLSNTAVDNRLAQQKFEFEKEEAAKRDSRQTQQVEAKINKPQEKLNKDINDINIAIKNMDDIDKLKNDVDTGLYVDKASKFANKYISSDLTSQSRKELESLVARVFNKETKSLAGSAVSASEWARIEPQIPSTADDDSLFRAKLKKAQEVARQILGERQKEYQRLRSGGTVDTSVVAAENAKTAAERPGPQATQRQSQGPYGSRVQRKGRWYVWDSSTGKYNPE